MDFFQNLNFSSSNEDGETELAALEGASRIICLTGSGTRPLDMLLSDAEEVIALDMNPAQNALLALKMAAIESLDYAEFLEFIGIADSRSRGGFYDSIRERLSPEVRAHWDANRCLLEAGVWNAGKWEKLLRWNARFLSFFRGRAVDELMAAPTIEDQARIWRLRFSDSRLRRAIEMIGRDWIWRWVMREPAGEFLPPPREVGERLAADFERAAGSHLFRESDFATLIFRGALKPGGALPIHLRPEYYPQIRDGLPRLRIVEGGLADLASLDIGKADGFSLSDFGSYCGSDIYAACWQGVLAAAEPGARYCERIFMNDMEVPFASIKVDHALSDNLSKSDKAIIYRVRAGTIER